MTTLRWRACFAACAAALVAVLLPSAGAQTSAVRTPPLMLVDQTPWVGAGGELVLHVRAPADLPDADLASLELSVAVHPAVGTRTAFQRTLVDRPNTSPLAVIATPTPGLVRDAAGAFEVRVGVQDPAQPRDAARVVLRNGGVYPVVVELRPPGGGAVRGRLTTHLLFMPAPPDGPRLGVTLVLPIARPPALQPDGTVRFADDAASSFTGLADALATTPTGVVLDPNPETLAALDRSPNPADGEALAALQRLAANRPVVLGEPFVPVPRNAYTGVSGLEALRGLIERGRAATIEALDSVTDAGITVLGPGIDEAHLPEAGTNARVVVPDRLLAPVEQRVTPANAIALRRGLGRSAATLPAVVADAALGAHFGSDRAAVLGAHQLLADLATIYFDSPGRRRAVVVMPPRSATLRRAQLAPFLAGLAASNILTLVDLDEQFTPPATGRPALRTLAAPLPARQPDGLDAVRDDVRSLSSAFADDTALVTNFGDRVLIAQSSDLHGRARSNYTRALARAVRTERGRFRLPRHAAARLTAREGRVPITVNFDADHRAKVLLEVASDKLQFPGGATRTLVLSRRNTTAQITVSSQGSGTFPLRVVLKTPDGKLVLAESRFTVQSTAISGVGVFLSVGALLVLGGWWIRHNRRYRPRQRGDDAGV